MQTRLHYRPHPKDREGNVFNLSAPRGVGVSWGSQPGGVSQGMGGGQLGGGVQPGGSARRGSAGGFGSAGGVSWVGGGGQPKLCVSGGGGGTQLGQQTEYSLHGGQYASCVHAGLSCSTFVFDTNQTAMHPKKSGFKWMRIWSRSSFTSCPSAIMLSSRFTRCLLQENSSRDLCWKDRRIPGSRTVAASTPTSYNKPSFNRSGSFAFNSSFK